jgi:hypothetical protein
MKTIVALLSVTLLLTACSKDGSSSSSQTNATPAASENPLDAPARYGSALARGQKLAEKTVDVAALTKAIEMFQVDKGRLPKDLNELVAGGFIRQIPPAPSGMKIVYDPNTGAVKMQPQ